MSAQSTRFLVWCWLRLAHARRAARPGMLSFTAYRFAPLDQQEVVSMLRCIGLSAIAAVLMSGQVVTQANPVAVPEQDRASRLKKQSKTSTAPVTIGGEITVTRELKAPRLRRQSDSRCKAVAEISYLQLNDRIRVDTAITSKECASSSGEYRLQVRTRGESGQAQLRTFTESWAATSDASDKAQKFYDMGGDTELLRARVHRVTCTCDGAGDTEQ
ncbi:MAG: hypothetical protein HKN70_10625 [Gammaproteobacteria bacterium]|nr:hypothetical protein [Gammaproteobacteria bacterium]